MRIIFPAPPLHRRASIAVLGMMMMMIATPLSAQAIGIGMGIGVGTRTGVSISLGAQVTDQVQLVCKGGGLPFLPSSLSCGTHLYLFDNRDRFVVAEAGVLTPTSHVTIGSKAETRWIFVQGGLGVRDHELPDDDGDGLPEYPRWVNVSWSGGLTLVVARLRQSYAPSDEGGTRRVRQLRPALWPLFFADGQMEIYLPGRDCARCGGPESQP